MMPSLPKHFTSAYLAEFGVTMNTIIVRIRI
jgi:hypothetical protein